MTEIEVKKNSSIKARRKDIRKYANAKDVLTYSINTGCDYLIKSKKIKEVFKVILYWYGGQISYGYGSCGTEFQDLDSAKNKADDINSRLDAAYKGVICARVRKIRITEEEI